MCALSLFEASISNAMCSTLNYGMDSVCVDLHITKAGNSTYSHISNWVFFFILEAKNTFKVNIKW